MSEWYVVKDADDIQISEDGKTVEINFTVNNSGNCYVEVPIDLLIRLLKGLL